MKSNWLSEFSDRMSNFAPNPSDHELPVSIKLKVESGCFCRSCCPEGHRLISDYVRQHPAVLKDAKIIEHESGPEILTYINLVAGASSLAAAVISLIVSIIQLRAEGIKRGDKRGYPFKLIIRRMENSKEFKEDIIMEIPLDADVQTTEIANRLLNYAKKTKKSGQPKTAKKKKS